MSEVTEVKAAAAADVKSLESRIAALEASAKTWYEKHVPLLVGFGGILVGIIIGHFVKL